MCVFVSRGNVPLCQPKEMKGYSLALSRFPSSSLSAPPTATHTPCLDLNYLSLCLLYSSPPLLYSHLCQSFVLSANMISSFSLSDCCFSPSNAMLCSFPFKLISSLHVIESFIFFLVHVLSTLLRTVISQSFFHPSINPSSLSSFPPCLISTSGSHFLLLLQPCALPSLLFSPLLVQWENSLVARAP